MSDKGWALTLLGAKTWGDGYIQGTDFEAYNWFVNITKRFNDNHQLSFTAFAAPQWHNQRNSKDGLTIEGWQTVANKYMNGDKAYKYNPSYGFGRNGQRKVSAHNVYNKPQLSLNHLWQINQKSSLSTALYASIGRGYGYAGQGLTSADRNNWYGSSYGTLNTTFRKDDGTFAYDEIYDLNETSENGSIMAMSKSKNYHNWYGLLSTYTTKFGENFDFYGGVDFRYYKGVHTNELVDTVSNSLSCNPGSLFFLCFTPSGRAWPGSVCACRLLVAVLIEVEQLSPALSWPVGPSCAVGELDAVLLQLAHLVLVLE